MTNSEAEAIINDPTRRTEFEAKTGISLSGMTKAEQRAAVKGYVDKNRSGNSTGVFDDNIGTTKNFATQEDVDAYIDYAYRYSDETKNKGNAEFPKQKSSIVISKADDRLVNDVKENYGIDLSGAYHVLNDNDIRHTKNSHGEDTNEKYPVTAEDQKKIPDIVANYDDVIYLKSKGGKEGLYYVKQHNGVTYYLEAIKDGKKVLSNKQMIKVSTGTIPEIPGLKDAIYKKWNINSAPDDNNIPRMYVQDVKNDVPTNIIADSEQSVKGESSAEMREAVTGGKFVLSDKVDLSHVEGKIDASDKRITDSIVLSSFLGERFGVVTKYIYDPRGRFMGRYESGAIFINLAKLGNRSSYEVLAHEFGHALKTINPKRWGELFTLVKNSTTLSHRYIDFRNKVYEKYKALGIEYKDSEIDDVAFSELLSECFVETFKNPESLRQMTEGKTETDKRLREKMRDVILDLIDNAKNFFAGRKNENIRKIVRDFDAIERKIVEVVNDSKYQENFDDDGEVRYSILEDVTDDKGNVYDKAVLLDTDFFDGISPRDWGSKLREYIEKRSAENPFILPVEDENGDMQMLSFANQNDRMRTSGRNERTVISELYRTEDNISKLAVIHIDEIVEASGESTPYFSPSTKNQWIDKNGWLHRNATVINRKSGAVYNLTFDIAKADDGRLILYTTKGKIKRMGDIDVGSIAKKAKGPQMNNHSKYTVTQTGKVVKENLEDGSSSGEYMPEGGYFDEDEALGTSGTPSPTESADGDYKENGKIRKGMSDSERSKILRSKSVRVAKADTNGATSIYNEKVGVFSSNKISDIKKEIRRIAEELGIINKKYQNEDIELEFSFSKGRLDESTKKQRKDYREYIELLTVLDKVVKNAVVIEVHEDKYKGTIREDPTLDGQVVLVGAFSDNNKGTVRIIPVKMEIKKFKDKENSLHLAIAISKKEVEGLRADLGQNQLSTHPTTSLDISITDLIKDVNPEEGDFLKYFPDDMLSDEQVQGKQNALKEQQERKEKLKNGNRVEYMPEGGYFDEDAEGAGGDYGYTHTTKRNVKEINELVDMEGNVADTSRIPTKSKLSRTKPKVLSKIELLDRQIEGCREIMRTHDIMHPKFKEASDKLDGLYDERDKEIGTIDKIEFLQKLRGERDGANAKRHAKFLMDAEGDICKGDKSAFRRMMRSVPYIFNDFERNMKKIFGKHYGYVKEHFVEPLFKAKKEATKAARAALGECDKKMKELGISYKSKEDAAIMHIGEGEKAPDLKNEDDVFRLEQKMKNMGYRDEEIAQHRANGFKGLNLKIRYTEADLYRDFGTERGRAILEASKFFREQYDRLIDEINLSQAKIYPNRKDKLVKKRKDYFHHFQEMSQGFSGLKNIFTSDAGINPLLAGVSEHTNPKEKWAGFKQQRTGNKTEESAIGGFVKYIQDAEYAIHINEHIENIRGLAIDLAEVKAFAGDTNANAAIIYLKDFANSLAGKTFLIDRIVDRFDSGRKILSVIGWFNSRAKANAILGNLSTMFVQPTNMLNTLQLIEKEGDIAKGFADYLAGLDESSEIAERYRESGFLTERYLDKEINKLTGNSGGAFGKLTGKDLSVWLGEALNVGDELGTKISWNAFYNEALRKGEADPSMYADERTRAAVAGRGTGEAPLVFSSKILSLFLPYRLEVNNNVNVIMEMLGSDKSAGFKVKKSLEFMLASWLTALALEAVTGNGSVFDPLGAMVKGLIQGTDEAEEEEEGTGKGVMLGLKYALQNLAGEAISNLPLGQAAVSILGVDENVLTEWTNGNVYVSGGVGVPAAGVISNAFRKGSVSGAAIEAALGFGTPFGGNQIKKTAKGIGELARGGAYEKDVLSGKSKGKLKYLVEPSVGNVTKEVLFGPSSLSENEDYYDGKLTKLTERETALIDEHEDFEGRKKEYEEIVGKKELAAEAEKKKENELKRKRTEYLKNINSEEWSSKLYAKGFTNALPVALFPEKIEWTEKKKKKVREFTKAERASFQRELDKLCREKYRDVIKTAEFRKAKLDEKEKMIQEAVSEALTEVKETAKGE